MRHRFATSNITLSTNDLLINGDKPCVIQMCKICPPTNHPTQMKYKVSQAEKSSFETAFRTVAVFHSSLALPIYTNHQTLAAKYLSQIETYRRLGA